MKSPPETPPLPDGLYTQEIPYLYKPFKVRLTFTGRTLNGEKYFEYLSAYENGSIGTSYISETTKSFFTPVEPASIPDGGDWE